MNLILCDRCGKEIRGIKNTVILKRQLFLGTVELSFCKNCLREICKYKTKKEKFLEEE